MISNTTTITTTVGLLLGKDFPGSNWFQRTHQHSTGHLCEVFLHMVVQDEQAAEDPAEGAPMVVDFNDGFEV